LYNMCKYNEVLSLGPSMHSLSCYNLPNDDRLFPGQLDTQLGNQNTPNSKWAVKRVERHVGSKTKLSSTSPLMSPLPPIQTNSHIQLLSSCSNAVPSMPSAKPQGHKLAMSQAL
jgi:hypothetical protein